MKGGFTATLMISIMLVIGGLGSTGLALDHKAKQKAAGTTA